MRGLYNILLAVKGAIAVLDKKERRMLLVLWMLSLSSYAVSVAMPTIEMFIADGVIGYIEGTRASLYLKWGIIGIIICTILGFGSRRIFFAWSNYVSSVISDSIYKSILYKSAKIKYKYFENKELYEEITKTADSVPNKISNMMTWNTLPPIVGGSLSMIIVSMTLIQVDWKIALLVFVGNTLSIYFYYKRMKDNFFLSIELIPQKRWADAYWKCLVSKDTIKEIKIFKLFDFLSQKWRVKSTEVQTENFKLAIKYAGILLLSDIVAIVFKALALIYTVYLVVFENINIGNIMLVYGSINVFNGYMSDISRAFINLGDNSLHIQNWIKFMEMEDEVDVDVTPSISSDILIACSNVRFKYPQADAYAINGITLDIKAGDRIAIVGENGSGKSTFVNLINGLFDDYEGHILFQGKEIKDNLTYIRQNISTIYQEFGKYDFSIRENISMGDANVEHDEVDFWDATNKSGAAAFIMDMEKKMDTMIGPYQDGTYLSGGQWQKIAISRTFLKDKAKLLILDEPTASLDPSSESEIYRRFLEKMDNQAVLMISHRLGATRFADRVLVFKEGKIIEDGTHEELMANKGVYWKMYMSQLALYKEVG
jgi:ABC superfamily ATP binding cassette transporter, membrane protein